MDENQFFEKRNSSSFIWDDKPASDWAEGYPLGNGRLGAMVYGRPAEEIFALNHDLLWRDYFKHPTYGTYRDIDEIKNLCQQKKWGEANRLMKKTIPCENAIYINPFVPAFDLYLNMKLPSEDVSGYRRGLDLERGTAQTEFVNGGISYTRTAFCSYDYGVIVVHLTASAPGTLTGEVSLSRMLDSECEVTGSAGYGYVTISGEFEEGKRFGGAVRILHRNGRITIGKRIYGLDGEEMPEKRFGLGYVFDRDCYINSSRGASVWFDSSDEVTLLVKIATDEEASDPAAYCIEKLSGGIPDYRILLMAHSEHFTSVYRRTNLTLGTEDRQESPDMTTPKRLQESKGLGELTPFLMELMYNSARYIAISSGMPQPKGSLPKAPINLQGIWCRDTRPAWESDYHTDLNIEMCYWPLVSGGLVEWYEPYLDWVERLMEQAKACAADLYGARGGTMNGCCDPKTLGGGADIGFGWLGSAAWLGQILWIYYEHDLREETLLRIYDILSCFAEFMEDMLVEEDGRLTFPFGSSPEMGHIVEGETIWLSSADTCDLELAGELFCHVAEAAEILGKPDGISEKYRSLAERIRPLPVDGNGCLMEWVEAHVEAQPGHRHRSPLIGFCPGTMINKRSQPETCDAMEKLLERRLAAGKGMVSAFSFAWDTQFMARFHRGDDAYETLSQIIYLMLGNMFIATNDYNREGYGIPWFPGTKVVQVEAQICLMASIGEMFYQDNDGMISPLPALPSKIRDGSMTGITGRNGFIVDICWKNGALERMRVFSRLGKVCRIHLPKGQIVTASAMPKGGKVDGDVLIFHTKTGEEYRLTFATVC